MVARQMLDNVLAQSGIPFDVREGTERQYQLLENYVELLVDAENLGERKISEAIVEPLNGPALN